MFSHLEKKILITITLLAIVAAAIIFGLIFPLIKNIKRANDTTYDLRVNMERRYERSQNLRSTLKQLAAIEKEKVDFSKHIFTTGQELELITNLEALAAKNNVTQKINSSNIDAISNQQVTLSLTTSGSYVDLFTYLRDLEKTSYFISVTRLTFTPVVDQASVASTDQAVLHVDLSLYVAP